MPLRVQPGTRIAAWLAVDRCDEENGHYIAAEAEKVGQFYHPILRFDGTEVELGVSEGGEPCGLFVNQGDKVAVEMMA